MSTTTSPVDQSAANITAARRYFLDMFERHDPNRFYYHSYGILDRANISLDSRFSVQASFFEVWRGLIDTPRRDWRFERTIFCLENKDDTSWGFNRKNEYFVLPAEAMVNMLDDEAPHEAVVSFHFDKKMNKLPDNEVRDDLKLFSFEKPSNKYMQSNVEEVSYIASLRISKSSGIPLKIKKALARMDTTFQGTYGRMMEVRALHQSKINDQENVVPAQELKADTSDTTVEPSNQADLNKTKPSSPKKSNKSKISSPKRSSPKSTDTANSDKECSYCARKTTPMWRRGPAGPGTLCNACGVKWRHGKILCNDNSTEIAATPSTATTENMNPLNTAKPNSTGTKRKYTKATETSQPAKKQQKSIAKKNTTTDLMQVEWSEISSSPSSSGSPHSLDLNTLIMDEAHQSLGLDAVEAATVLTLLKRN